MKDAKFLLWIICLWLWTNCAVAQQVVFAITDGDYGQIAIHKIDDIAKFAVELDVAVDSLARKRGIILDMRNLRTEQQVYNTRITTAIQDAFADYTKAIVLLMDVPVRWETALGVWVKDRHWTKFESSGSLDKAEAKVKTLASRHMKEGQERMDWLMQQKGAK